MGEYKAAVVGPGGVGKTSLITQFVQNQFYDEYDPTVEDTYRKHVTVDEQDSVLAIMDTSGQHEWANPDFYKHAGQGFVLVYSTTSKWSYNEIMRVFNEICTAKDSAKVPMILVGNKSDLEDQREVTTTEGADLAFTLKIPFFETSAKMRVNVDEVFQGVLRQIKAEVDPPVNATRKKRGSISLSKCSIL